MKNLSFLLILIFCFSLCACNITITEAPAEAVDVQITAGKIEPGMMVQDILVEVTIDHQPVACRVELTRFTDDGFYTMADVEAVPEDFFGRLDVYYSLPKGITEDNINVVMECDGGEYDGTGSYGNDDDGCVVAWSHAIYGTDPATLPTLDVKITAGKIEPGMTVKDIDVEVIVDGKPADHTLELTCFTSNGYYTMDETEPVEEGFSVRLDVYYSLPEGVDVDHINVVMECDGGEYDGTGSYGNDDNGRVIAWSHAIYESDTAPTDPTESSPIATPPTTPLDTVPTTPPETAPVVHTHTWTEDPSRAGPVGCTFDGYKTFVCQCGETKKETIPATGHEIVISSTTQPTCTSSGRQVSHCKHCGAGYINDLPATGHSWSDWAYENGRIHKRTCSICQAEEEANHQIPAGSLTCSGCGEDIVN